MTLKLFYRYAFIALNSITLSVFAADAVFDQPGMEARINLPHLGRDINAVVDGEVTGIDVRAGVFSVTGRRVPFVHSSSAPTMTPSPEPIEASLPPPPAVVATPPNSTIVTTARVPESAIAEAETERAINVTVEERSKDGVVVPPRGPAPMPAPAARPKADATVKVAPPPAPTTVRVAPPFDPESRFDARDFHVGVRTNAPEEAPMPQLNRLHFGIYDMRNGAFDRPAPSLGLIERIPPPLQASPDEIAASIPPFIARPPCACTRIVVAPLDVSRVQQGADGQYVIRPSREPAPLASHRFFSKDTGLTLLVGADLDQSKSLQKDNVLHPIDYPDSAKRPWDTACNCDNEIVIRPYSNAFTPSAEPNPIPRRSVVGTVEYEKAPVANPLPPQHPEDVVENVQSALPAWAKDLRVGDHVLVGYTTGSAEVPQLVIRANAVGR